MKKTIAALAVFLSLIGYSVYNRRVLIPGSKVYVRIPFGSSPRLWGNAVEFDHHGWQEICIEDNGRAICRSLAKASPK
jgi:hypothetical protein